jgi:hypothetical protein
MKRTRADILFSKYIRLRDNYTCQRCFKRYPENSLALDCSHLFSRGKFSTRFDEENCDAFCYGCHSYWHRNPIEYHAWKRNQLGENVYNLLTLRANTKSQKYGSKKQNIKANADFIKLKIKYLEEAV